MVPGDIKDTFNNESLYPFLVENNGNSVVNISTNTSRLFESSLADLPSEYYQFRITEEEAGSFNTQDSITSWTQIPSGPIDSIAELDWEENNDNANMEVYVKAPSDEPSGTKNSTTVFTASLAE